MTFWSKVQRTRSCWLWRAYKDRDGYGRLSGALAHRTAYKQLVGPIPEGMQLDHLCRVRNCVNPGHLEPVTNKENQMRGFGISGVNARKTHCANGHEFTETNTYSPPSDPNRRDCRICRAAWAKARKATKGQN